MRARSETPTQTRTTARATARPTLRPTARPAIRGRMRQRAVRIAALVAVLTVLCPIVASACQYCAVTGFLQAECSFPRTWWQWSFAYESCNVVERCFLGVCISFCRTSVTCYADIAPDGLAGDAAAACGSENTVYVLA